MATTIELASASRVEARYTQDVRLAVVLYGGVSLAIYIHGVAQELLRLVRATAEDGHGRALLESDELHGSEKVYRRLGQLLARGEALPKGPVALEDPGPLRTRFVVDVLSGTSAGGINAIFLAKALANEQSMDRLKQLWVEEGDLGKLLNDAASVRDLPALNRQRPPRSLLNGERMYVELLKAFRCMDGATDDGTNKDAKAPGTGSRLVEDLDLFVTTTDVRGALIKLRLADGVVDERRFKRVFHFDYHRTPPSSTFAPDYNGLLAFAARCTSAFPFAFEPMQADAARRLQRQFPTRPRRPERPVDTAALAQLFRELPEQMATDPSRGPELDFGARSFVDGGYLDNKPFTYAIEALRYRHAARPVDRKLIYVEPAPEHPKGERVAEEPPDALTNVQAALVGVPRHETIREDLQAVLARNRLVERVEGIIDGAVRDHWPAPEKYRMSPEDFARGYLADMIKVFGPPYGGYQRLKVAAVSDLIAQAVTGAAGLDPTGDELLAVRYLVRAWRDDHYTYWPEQGKASFNVFLMQFDLEYRIRRLAYVLARLDELPAFDERARRLLRRAHVKAARTLRKLPAESPVLEDFRAEVARLKTALQPELDSLVAVRDAILRGDFREASGRNGRPGWAAASVAPGASGELHTVLRELLDVSTEDDRRARAAELIGLGVPAAAATAGHKHRTGLDTVLNALRTRIRVATEAASAASGKVLAFPPVGRPGPALQAAKHFYEHYEAIDLIVYPLLYATGAGEEMDPVEVVRISPEDALSLVSDPKEAGRKLAGTRLAHFGAFLDPGWRINDMLWGRLDGAERLIAAMLPPGALRADLIRKAHVAILAEEHGLADRRTLAGALAQWVRAGGGKSRRALEGLLARGPQGVESVLEAALRDDLTDEDLCDYFQAEHGVEALKPAVALELIARAATVTGGVLDDVAARRGNTGKPLAHWLTRVGRTLTAMVTVATPGGLAYASGPHVAALLYLLELLVLGGAWVLNVQPVQDFALKLLVLTFGVHSALAVLEGVIRWPRAMRTLGRALVALAMLALLGLAAYGAAHLARREVSGWLGPLDGRLAGVLAVLASLALLPAAVRALRNGFRRVREAMALRPRHGRGG